MGFIDYEVDGAVGIITINRPRALNALNEEVLNDLEQVLDAVDVNAIRCLILTGAGEKSFVAGADIGAMSTMTKAEGTAFGKKGNDIFLKIEKFPIPVIAAIKAKQLIYTARNIDAKEAYRIGLVNAVYPLEELLPAAKKMAATIAGNAPIAVRACKKAINEGLQVSIDEGCVIEEELFGSCFESYDQQEGMANFLRKKDDPKKVRKVAFKNE